MAEGSAIHVALLRGVNNAGKSPRVAMAELRALFEKMGFRDVRTLLNSGNVVFSFGKNQNGDIGARIEKALASKLHVTVPVVVLSMKEVEAVVHRNPLAMVAVNPSHLLVLVPSTKSGLSKLKGLLSERWTPEALAVGDRVAYLWCANGVAKSRLWAAVDRALGKTGTARNISTFTKALALAGSISATGVPVESERKGHAPSADGQRSHRGRRP